MFPVNLFKASKWTPGFRPILAVVLGLVAHSLPADTVTIASGSTLNGTFKRITKGKVHLDTGFAGVLKIDQKQVTVPSCLAS